MSWDCAVHVLSEVDKEDGTHPEACEDDLLSPVAMDSWKFPTENGYDIEEL